MELNYNICKLKQGKWQLITQTTAMVTTIAFKDEFGVQEITVNTVDIEDLLKMLLKLTKT